MDRRKNPGAGGLVGNTVGGAFGAAKQEKPWIRCDETSRGFNVDRVVIVRARQDPAEGKTLGDFDLLIGATALHRGVMVLTNSRRHFEFDRETSDGFRLKAF